MTPGPTELSSWLRSMAAASVPGMVRSSPMALMSTEFASSVSRIVLARSATLGPPAWNTSEGVPYSRADAEANSGVPRASIISTVRRSCSHIDRIDTAAGETGPSRAPISASMSRNSCLVTTGSSLVFRDS
jgi:hypothetical protein